MTNPTPYSAMTRPALPLPGIFLILTLLIGVDGLHAKSFSVKSPNQRLVVTIETEPNLNFTVAADADIVLEQGIIGLELRDQGLLPGKANITCIEELSEDRTLTPVVARVTSSIHDQFNGLVIGFENGIDVEFRAFNDGVAYRFHTHFPESIDVLNEQIDLTFPEHTSSFFPREESMISHNERIFEKCRLDSIGSDSFCSLPVMMVPGKGSKVLFSEADLFDYPALYMKIGAGNCLLAKHPARVIKAIPQPGAEDRNQIIQEEADDIARTSGERSFPWRVFVIGDDGVFLENELIYQLSRENPSTETNWINPGRVAWDWYNANNIFDVDFKSGINTRTYQYYIDFAAEYGLEYIILDEGWSKSTTELDAPAPDMDIEEIVRYGKANGVGVILWALWGPIAEQREYLFPLYEKWGIAGVKIDFMQRSDQEMVNFYRDTAALAFKHHLLVDYHGAFKPAGLRREFPNVISYEGVKGNENNKWSHDITPTHNVTIPFTRMAVGPMDYTPGAMVNKHRIDHNISFERPEGLGTRAHEVAKYVVYTSPLQMLCDTPSVYRKEDETTSFVSKIPSVWDETRVLAGEVGEYILVARRNGNSWYIGGMTNENSSRELTIDLSFVGTSTVQAQIYKDGVNADRYAQDYQLITESIDTTKPMTLHMGSGGGWSAILCPTEVVASAEYPLSVTVK